MEKDIDIAKAYFDKNKLIDCINICYKLLVVDEKSVVTLKLLSKSLIQVKREDEARLYLNKALELKNNDYEILKDIGYTYQVEGDTNKAKKYYRESLLINEGYTPALINLGYLKLKDGETQEALGMMIKAQKLDPTSSIAWAGLANIYLKIKKLQNAEVACKKSIEIDPKNFNWYFLLSKIYIEQNKFIESIDELKKTIALNNGFIQAHISLAAILYNEGKNNEAELECLKVIKLNPNIFNAYYIRSKILYSQRKLEEASNLINEAIKIKPDFAEAYLHKAIILLDAKKLEKAQLSIKKAIEINPNIYNFHFIHATILIKLKQLDSAKESLIRTIKLKPDLAEGHLNLGATLIDIGKTEEAEVAIREAIELNPNLTIAYYHLGNILLKKNKLEEAERCFRDSIKLKPGFSDALFNLGAVLKNQNKLKEAKEITIKAIQIKPNNSSYQFNLSVILQELGEILEAEKTLHKAININPKQVNAYRNLGIILRNKGKLKEAENIIKRALIEDPNESELYAFLCIVLNDQGEEEKAFEAIRKAIHMNPKKVHFYNILLQLITEIDPTKLNKSSLNQILIILLDRNDINHMDLINIFNFLYPIKKLIEKNHLNEDIMKNNLFQNLIKNKIIIKALKKIIFRGKDWELLLTQARKSICKLITEDHIVLNEYEFNFTIALAEQCFLNEYVYFQDDQDYEFIKRLQNKNKHGKIDEQSIAIQGCYIPIYKNKQLIPLLKKYHSKNKSFNSLVKLQLHEPLDEIELSKELKKVGTIANTISKKIKSQYEQNPYPRWRFANYSKDVKIDAIQIINNEIRPNCIIKSFNNKEQKILIAGCGTGKQIMQAQRYRNAFITAIDLSGSSLAYAKRKINELKIKNVNLKEMDILDIHLLEEEFDIIECGGVLHHMNEPLAGLQSLLSSLKKNSYLKLGLYSEIARKEVVRIRDYIKENNYNSNPKGIRKLRREILEGKLKNIKFIQNTSDFYSLSECRDLCFNVKEHRFTIQGITEILNIYKLEFLGFMLPAKIKLHYNKLFPKDIKQTNLSNWSKFEERYPDSFKQMYQFWVQKL